MRIEISPTYDYYRVALVDEDGTVVAHQLASFRWTGIILGKRMLKLYKKGIVING